MTDRIALRGIRAFGRHGANPGEKTVPQPLDLDVCLEVDLSAARRSDALNDTLDYAALHAAIVEVVATTSYDLLERIGQAVIDAVLRDPRVQSVEVSIGKPRLLAGATPVVTVSAERAHLARIGLGSNVGDAAANVRAALAALATLGSVTSQSSLYRSTPWGVRDQADFVNAAALLRTPLAPHPLLRALKALEDELGRTPTYRWGPRVIDLDLLAYDDLRLADLALTLPHPRLRERAFALVPLAEIDADYAEAAAALAPNARAEVTRIASG